MKKSKAENDIFHRKSHNKSGCSGFYSTIQKDQFEIFCHLKRVNTKHRTF